MNSNPQSAFEQYKANCIHAEIYSKRTPPEMIDFIEKLKPEAARELNSVLSIGDTMMECFRNMLIKDEKRFRPCDHIVGFLRRGLHALMISGEYTDAIQMEHDAIMLQCLIETLELIDEDVQEVLQQSENVSTYYISDRFRRAQKNYIDYSEILLWLTPSSNVIEEEDLKPAA